MAAEVCETPFPERAGKIAADAQEGRLAAATVHAGIVQLAEEALGRAAKDLAVSKSALLLGGGTGPDARLRAGEACDAMELCCDRLLLVDLLLGPPPRPRAPVPGADDDGRAAAALEKAMEMAEDCAALVRRARAPGCVRRSGDLIRALSDRWLLPDPSLGC